MKLKNLIFAAALFIAVIVIVLSIVMNTLCQATFVTQNDMPSGTRLLSTDQITYYPEGNRMLQIVTFGSSDLIYDGQLIKSKDGRTLINSIPVISVQVLALNKNNIALNKINIEKGRMFGPVLEPINYPGISWGKICQMKTGWSENYDAVMFTEDCIVTISLSGSSEAEIQRNIRNMENQPKGLKKGMYISTMTPSIDMLKHFIPIIMPRIEKARKWWILNTIKAKVDRFFLGLHPKYSVPWLKSQYHKYFKKA